MAHSLRTALIGQTLQDKYRIDRVVGEGGFAVVYAGQHLTLDVPVAVKALMFHRDQSPEHRALLLSRFSAEAQILARLRHPNIVSVLDFGILNDDALGAVPWLVLEWCDGETLDAELRRRRRALPRLPQRSVEEAWALMRPIVDAVAYGHSLGVAHRDLKPANVMLVPDRTGISPRVLDFGIAKRVEDTTSGSGETLTNSGAAMFTPGYAAPEQVAMVRTGPWTDVHALGLMFTEILTDERPYPTANGAVAAVDPERPTPSRFGRDVGPLEPLLAKAVALRPGERYADAEQFLDALDSAFGTHRLQVPRPSAPSDDHRAPSAASLAIPDETFRTGAKTLQASTTEAPEIRARSGRLWLVLVAVGTTVVAFAAVVVLALLSRRAASAERDVGAGQPGVDATVSSAAQPTSPPATASAAAEPSASGPSVTSGQTPPAPTRPTTRPPSSKPVVRPGTTASSPVSTGRPPPALY